jgi:hypothetical protein
MKLPCRRTRCRLEANHGRAAATAEGKSYYAFRKKHPSWSNT